MLGALKPEPLLCFICCRGVGRHGGLGAQRHCLGMETTWL